MVDKLGLYNMALQTHLDSRPILTLSDARTERRALDRVWAETQKYMLEQGMWNFASRAQQWMPSDTVDPAFAYQHAYEKPDDYVRLVCISDNEWLRPTLPDYSEEGDFIYADVDPIYVKYVSSDTEYGLDVGKYPPTFAAAFAAELAWRARGGVRPMSTVDTDQLAKVKKRLLNEAKAKDAVNQPMAQIPDGRMVSARRGRMGLTNRMRRTPYQ